MRQYQRCTLWTSQRMLPQIALSPLLLLVLWQQLVGSCSMLLPLWHLSRRSGVWLSAALHRRLWATWFASVGLRGELRERAITDSCDCRCLHCCCRSALCPGAATATPEPRASRSGPTATAVLVRVGGREGSSRAWPLFRGATSTATTCRTISMTTAGAALIAPCRPASVGTACSFTLPRMFRTSLTSKHSSNTSMRLTKT
mmetsp:Transcript_80823/g.228767  ORF Transcript_80823/g.228767 Transcript_80823/m.228767 type:complete len:201 (+) Transcript_80823:758-1360(+)